MPALVFIDTNVLLDFYRSRGAAGEISFLHQIDSHRKPFITSEQVEMEYKKHRQRVILESSAAHQQPEWAKLAVPAYLRAATPVKMIAAAQKRCETSRSA